MVSGSLRASSFFREERSEVASFSTNASPRSCSSTRRAVASSSVGSGLTSLTLPNAGKKLSSVIFASPFVPVSSLRHCFERDRTNDQSPVGLLLDLEVCSRGPGIELFANEEHSPHAGDASKRDRTLRRAPVQAPQAQPKMLCGFF